MPDLLSRSRDWRGREHTPGISLATDLYEQLLRVTRLAIPVLADYTAVDLLDDTGRLRRLGMAHHDPATESRLSELMQREALVLERGTPTTRALATGRRCSSRR